jgi:hypothetical protein
MTPVPISIQLQAEDEHPEEQPADVGKLYFFVPAD